MQSPVTLAQFYKEKLADPESVGTPNFGNFNVFNIRERVMTGERSPSFVRRDFYKIMLYRGDNTFHYSNSSVPVSGNTLLFFNPMVPYTYEPLSADTSGYFCVFKADFIKDALRTGLNDLPLFTAGNIPIFSLTDEQADEVEQIFMKMESELASGFIYKYDLIRSYVTELIYYGLKLSPQNNNETTKGDASSRVMRVFLELLERQFPIENTAQRFALRSPADVAVRMALHVNYLNRAIKKASGKTTSQFIFDRIVTEARTLLKHTDWSVAEIGYSLGFEDPAHFNHFIKKQTGRTPLSLRDRILQ